MTLVTVHIIFSNTLYGSFYSKSRTVRIEMKNFIKKKPVVILFLVFLAVLIFLFSRNNDWSTKTALRHMEKLPLYHKFHEISNTMNDKRTEIFLEKGNYAWGGYEAVLFIETKKEVKFYSYIFHQKGFKFFEKAVPKNDFKCFYSKLVEKGVWKLHNRFYNPFVDPIVDDGPTYFLKIMNRKKKKHVAVYSPQSFKGARNHWGIIKIIEEFCLKSIKGNESDE
ncbi:MAG: hypothetical protein GY795_19050 [Desulfobacterales bacterium]|nr:hypothetical protein [Desulfobacterales bacterium]